MEADAKSQSRKSDRPLSLQLMKVSLLFFLLCSFIVGKQESTWPLISWVLYSGYSARFRPPEPSVSVTELRIRTVAGEAYTVKPEQILSIPYDSLSHSIVEQAFDDANPSVRDESRQYLVRAISRLIRPESEIETVQAWKISYATEPLSVPPLQRDNPTTTAMIGSFSSTDIARAGRGEAE